MKNNYEPLPIEKIISILSYCTCGIVGFFWIVFGAIKNLSLRPFLKFHIYQSIFLSVLVSVGLYLLDIVFKILSLIPFIKTIVGMATFVLIVPLVPFFGKYFSLLNILVLLLVIYLCIGVLRNKFSYIPWVSDVIRANVERS